MKILVVLEHDGEHLRPAARSAITFARQWGESAQIDLFLMGRNLGALAREAAVFGRVVTADDPSLAPAAAPRCAALMTEVVLQGKYDVVAAASTTFAKDVLSRLGGMLGGSMISDIWGHEWKDGALVARRAMYAGAVVATVQLIGHPKVVTVRASAYVPADPLSSPGEIHNLKVPPAQDTRPVEVLETKKSPSGRPDVTEARVVVSGGRALKNSGDYERLVGGLADVLGAATGSSRVLVDGGITPNNLQVGQTGKIVAPDLYIALGISGAVQHLAGMKNSKCIVAVNQDPDAPIFEAADYGLVGDVYEVVPQLIDQLHVD